MPAPHTVHPNISLHRAFLAPTLPANGSWWAGLSREAWREKWAKEQERMPWTQFGKTNLHILSSGTRERQQGLIEGYQRVRKMTMAGEPE
jgi:hypothetical protein